MRKSSDEDCAQSTAAAEEDTPILRNLPPWCFAGAVLHNGQKKWKLVQKLYQSRWLQLCSCTQAQIVEKYKKHLYALCKESKRHLKSTQIINSRGLELALIKLNTCTWYHSPGSIGLFSLCMHEPEKCKNWNVLSIFKKIIQQGLSGCMKNPKIEIFWRFWTKTLDLSPGAPPARRARPSQVRPL